MKTKIATLSLLLTAGLAFGQQDEQGPVISGVEWATKNVAEKGYFATDCESCSHYYQWNSDVGVVLGNQIPGGIDDPMWTVNPCPSDWRLPTEGEKRSLETSGSTWAAAGSNKGNIVAGRFFGPGHATATISDPGGAIFMPACGWFLGGSSAIEYGNWGNYYYSATVPGSYGRAQWFTPTGGNGLIMYRKYCAYSLRCVRAEWLTIDGIEWAKANLTIPGVFASKPDMQTEFYQWGKNEAHPTTGSPTNWDATPASITEWTDNPCPTGWRLPTFAEFEALTDEGYMWASAEYDNRGNAVDGIFLGRNSETCTLPDDMIGCVFLPANGARNRNGALTYEGLSAFYWSSEQVSVANGRGLRADEMGGVGIANANKAFGYNIRCVHDLSSLSEETNESVAANTSSLSFLQANNHNATMQMLTMTEASNAMSKIETATLYPNPVTNGQLTIDNGELAIGKVEVLNQSGVVVRKQDFGSQTTGTLQLHGLQGTYFVKVGNSNMQSIVVIN